MGAKIPEKTFANANAGMKLPVDNNGFDNHTTVESVVIDYGRDVENMIQGDGQGGVITNPSGAEPSNVTLPAFKNTEVMTISGGTVTPDLSRSYNFSLTLTEDTTISLPSNVTRTGVSFRIYIQQDGTGGHALNFSVLSNRYAMMSGSQPMPQAAGARAVIEVFIYSLTSHPYRLTEFVQGDYGMSGLIPFDITLTPAQVLASNTTPIEIAAAPGANKIAVLVEFSRLMTYVSAAYATNVSSLIRYSGGDAAVSGVVISQAANFYTQHACGLGNTAGIGVDYTDLAVNEALQFFTTAGNPTAGDSPIRLKGFYRIIDLASS